MNRGRHLHGAAGRRGLLGGFVSSVRAKFGQGGAHSWRPKHVRAEDGRIHRLRSPIVLFVSAFVFASGTAAFAYTMGPGSGTGHAQAVTLNSPGAGSASRTTTTSLSLSWEASSGLPPGGGYLVLRSTSSGGPYSKVSSGPCNQVITLVSAATMYGHGSDSGYDLLLRGGGRLLQHKYALDECARLSVLGYDQPVSSQLWYDRPGSGYHKRKFDEFLRRQRRQLPGDGLGQSRAHLLEHGIQRLHSIYLALGRHVLQQWPPVGHRWRRRIGTYTCASTPRTAPVRIAPRSSHSRLIPKPLRSALRRYRVPHPAPRISARSRCDARPARVPRSRPGVL